MEFREAARVGVRAEVLEADRGQMPVNELVGVLSAVSNISRRTALLVTTQRLSIGPADLSSVQVLVRSPQSGSFVVELAIQVGTNVIANLATPPILEAMRRVYRLLSVGRMLERTAELNRHYRGQTRTLSQHYRHRNRLLTCLKRSARRSNNYPSLSIKAHEPFLCSTQAGRMGSVPICLRSTSRRRKSCPMR
jgi:hypothetical protein